MKYLIWLVAVVVLTGLWVRLAPSSVDRWHIAKIDPDSPKRSGYFTEMQLTGTPAEVLGALDGIARASARTKVLAGSVAQGRITYISRSKLWGFPDYTTVIAREVPEGSQLSLYGRLRFGISDTGVNRRRIQTWLQALQPLQQ